MIILGIDPGTVRIGYGVIKRTGSLCSFVSSGLLPISASEQGKQLIQTEKLLSSLIKKYSPDVVGVEKIFFAKNVKTALNVAHARGVIIATIAKHKKTSLCELGPSEIKLAVAGDGNASKDAVARMVGQFLKKSQIGVIDDVSDALAIAIAASYVWG